MVQKTLEERVATLERKMANLEAKSEVIRQKDWRRTLGMFAGDEVMKEILGEALRFRERDREKAQRQCASRRKEMKS